MEEEAVMPIEVEEVMPIAVPPRVPLVRQRGRQYLLDNNIGIYEVDEDGDVVMGE
jgi:hypothetical protein